MNAKTRPCIVQFVGGPSDGLILTEPHFQGQDRLQMPAEPAFAPREQHDRCELAGTGSTAYRLTCRVSSFDAGQPTTCLRYDFLGYGLLEGQVERKLARQRALHRWVRPRNWISNLNRKLTDWMLEPIDYPLNMARLGGPATSGRRARRTA